MGHTRQRMGIQGPNGGYGSRSQVGALGRSLDDVEGNKDGVAGNEQGPRLPLGQWLEGNPLLQRAVSFFDPGLSTGDEQDRLTRFVKSSEARWGERVTQLAPGTLPDQPRFEAEKAIALTRFNRSPADVTEGFVHAGGTVNGQRIEDREVFFQRWKPIGEPSGKVVVVSPGFQETGRNFYEQIQLLNQEGHDVLVMDHQWAGYTEGKKGTLDRGFGVARDVAAVAAKAAQVAEQDYGTVPGSEVILLGNSMGAGPGVLGAITLNDQGKLTLDGGAQMPRGLKALLQAPFLEPRQSAVNKAVQAAGNLPLANDVWLPATGLPVLTEDPIAAAKFAQHAVAENVGARLSAMTAANEDLATLKQMLAEGKGPAGKVYFIHGDQDPLADVAGTERAAKQLGDQAKAQVISSRDHILEESPSQQGHILEGMAWLTANR